MRITNPPSILTINSNNKNKIDTLTSNPLQDAEINNYTTGLTSTIHFGALHNIKPKKIDLNLEKNKLLKQISEILHMDISDIDISEIVMSAAKRAVSFFLRTETRKAEILAEMENLSKEKLLNSQQRINQFRQLEKEYKLLENQRPKYTEPTIDARLLEQMDFPLLNKFKTAILEEDYDLLKIFKSHYGKLNDINTIDELKEVYPKIAVPTRPENAIANKITGLLTRDFFEELDDLIIAGNRSEVFEFSDKKIRSILGEVAKAYNVDEFALYIRVAKTVHETILDKYSKIVTNDSFSSLPQQRKIKQLPVSINDLKLLAVDFDDLVLTTLRKQYLDSQN